MKCPDCKHDLSWHYEDDGCGFNPHCECDKSPSDVYYELLTEAKKVISNMQGLVLGLQDDDPFFFDNRNGEVITNEAANFLKKLEDSPA